MKKELVAILIFAHKAEINNFEKVSLLQCSKILHRYPIYLVCPRGLNVKSYKDIFPSIEIDFIDPFWLSSYRMYNRLKISHFLYNRYKKFEFILTYELDAFVFRDELEYWCSKEYDYIGAPWYEGWEQPSASAQIVGVGNSGFSLRRTSSALRALYSFSYIESPLAFWKSLSAKGHRIKGAVSYIKHSTFTNNSFFLLNHFTGNEDVYWGYHINKNFEWFIVAPINDAWKFSFEVNPHLLFEMNDLCLPFGCHAWWKYNSEFWLPHIKSFNHLDVFLN